MLDCVEKVIYELVDCVSSRNGFPEQEIEDDVKGTVSELLDRVSFRYEPSELDFFLDYRVVPSLASASSHGDNELGEISDGELPFLASDEDSDKEFEKLQYFTYENRTNMFKREHSVGIPSHKKPKPESRVDTNDLYHEYDSLPPLERLTIHCEEAIPLELVGHVTSVVDCLVVIQSENGVALDLDSVLFDKDRKSIGVVFDLFGPVKSPLYSIRFNTKEEASTISVGMQVYYAPEAKKYTKTIIETINNEASSGLEDLLDDEVAFSDDEKEKEYRARKMACRGPPKKGEHKRNICFSGSTVQSERGGSVKSRNDNRGKSWNWHTGGSRIARGTKRRNNGKEATVSASGSAEVNNPYAEYGCYGSTPFVDTRNL